MMSNPLSGFSSDAGEASGASGLAELCRLEFSCLKSLNVGQTAIESWEVLDELRQFPCLNDVCLHSIACMQVIGYGRNIAILCRSVL